MAGLPAVAFRWFIGEDVTMTPRSRCESGAGTTAGRVARVIGLALLVALSGAGFAAEDGVRELEWDELMPRNWNPFAGIAAELTQGVEDLSDGSAEANALMDAYREAVRSAPVVSGLDGQRIRLPGFVVPLDFDGSGTSEFLLVPYFGACIHVPPPPPNQIVYVQTISGYPLKGLFDAVWVTGVISVQAHLNDVGDAGYTLQATIIEPF